MCCRAPASPTAAVHVVLQCYFGKNIYFWLPRTVKKYITRIKANLQSSNYVFVTETRLGSKPSFMRLTRPPSRASRVPYDSKAKVDEAILSYNRLSVSPFTLAIYSMHGRILCAYVFIVAGKTSAISSFPMSPITRISSPKHMR